MDALWEEYGEATLAALPSTYAPSSKVDRVRLYREQIIHSYVLKFAPAVFWKLALAQAMSYVPWLSALALHDQDPGLRALTSILELF